MSKLMLAFLLLCSLTIYNPQGVRNFTRQHAGELSAQFKSALYTVDRMLPNFMRFGRS